MMQGVKPWDDDAMAVMAVLNGEMPGGGGYYGGSGHRGGGGGGTRLASHFSPRHRKILSSGTETYKITVLGVILDINPGYLVTLGMTK